MNSFYRLLLAQRSERQSLGQGSGFTLIEVLVVVVMVGILSAIGAPSWQGFMTQQTLNAGRERVIQAMRQAQSKAIQERRIWQVSFRNQGNTVQVAVHANAAQPPANVSSLTNLVWEDLPQGLQLDFGQTNFFYDGCTPATSSTKCTGGSSSSNYFIRYSFIGQLANPNMAENVITLSHQANPSAKACLTTETILGALRTGKRVSGSGASVTCN